MWTHSWLSLSSLFIQCGTLAHEMVWPHLQLTFSPQFTLSDIEHRPSQTHSKVYLSGAKHVLIQSS